MVKSSATTVKEYLASLPADRRKTIEAVRKVILANLPKGYEETMNWGMISYEIPLKRYPTTYNKQPLALAALAAQKNGTSLYLMHVYADPELHAWFLREWKKSGKKLDMGKSCIRFDTEDDLPLPLIGETITRMSVDEYIAIYERSRAEYAATKTKKPARKK